jgi:hypothetical protein
VADTGSGIPGPAVAHLRPVLLDEGNRKRHRARTVDYLRNHPGARRDHQVCQRSRPGYSVYAGAPALVRPRRDRRAGAEQAGLTCRASLRRILRPRP